jgi:hypothetical protein
MHPLPIFGVIGRTIAFEVTNLWTLFRLTWFPLALLLAAGIGVAYVILQSIGNVEFASSQGLGAFLWLIWTSMLLQTIAITTVAVQVHRVVLFNDRQKGHYFLFPFGWTEVRYIIMGILTSIFLALPVAVVYYLYLAYRLNVGEAAIAVLLAAQNVPATPEAAWTTMLVIGLLFIFIIWLALRLSVWPAAVVANNRLALGDAWRTTRGNVLRLLLMFIFSYVVLIVVVICIQVAFVLAAPQDFVAQVPAKKPLIKDALGTMAILNPNAILLQFINQFLSTTYAVATLSFAYRAMKGAGDGTPIDEQSTENDPSLHMPMGAH